MDFLKRTWIEVNLDNAQFNLQSIRSVCAKPFMVVIKANAYGHGAIEMARFYMQNGVTQFAVSNIEEAIELRRGGVTGDILILGFTPCTLAAELAEYDLIQTVLSCAYAHELSAQAKQPIRIHIKLDTGMGRIGLDCRESVADCIEEIREIIDLPRLKFQGLFTHFSSADSTRPDERAYVQRQYDLFCDAVRTLRAEGYVFMTHCCNSAATLLDLDKHCDAVRPGIILYGLTPAADLISPVPLRPVMTLKTTVAMVKTVAPETYVSYGRTFRSDRPMRIATLPVGYADGYLRALSGKADVLLHGKRARVLGRVCMDQMMVDVTEIPNVQEGDEVILFGETELTANELAKQADTIGYELLCGIARRVPRVYLSGGAICDIHSMIET
ncbi:MAG: alanine racemase [Clostridia bacterium]|nr:alanine racemase [Clostridia bacterium]